MNRFSSMSVRRLALAVSSVSWLLVSASATGGDSDFAPISTSFIRALAPTNAISTALFGHSVSIAGTTAAVGAVRDNSAFVFERDLRGSNRWGLRRRLVASDRSTSNRFGVAVAISGDTVAIGDTDGGDRGSGAVYLFQKNKGGTGSWGQLKKVVPSDPGFLDRFGGAVALQGSTLVVGAALEDAAYIFLRDSGGANRWGQARKLTGPRDSSFGTCVATSGDLALVGAASAAYLYGRNQGGANRWGLVKILTPGENAGAFGSAVALSASYAVVGAPGFDISHDEGAAYLFHRNQGGTNNWGRLTRLLEPNTARGRRFGYSVAIAGSTALIGSRALHQESTASFFSQNQGGLGRWGAVASWRTGDGTFGTSVALTTTNAIVGQNEEIDAGRHNGPGHAFVFTVVP